MDICMKKINSFIGKAPKLKGEGAIQYCLWVDSNGDLYIQLEHNERSGTFSTSLFSVTKYAPIRHIKSTLGEMQVFDIEDGNFVMRKDNNNGAFLKAVLIHLLPDIET